MSTKWISLAHISSLFYLLFSSCTSKSWCQVSRKFHCISMVSKQTYKLFWRNWYPSNTHLLLLSSTSSMLCFLDSKTPPLMSHIINLIDFCKNQNRMLCYIQNVTVLLNPFDPWIAIRVAGPALSLLPSWSSEEIYLSYMFGSFEVKHASGLVDSAT